MGWWVKHFLSLIASHIFTFTAKMINLAMAGFWKHLPHRVLPIGRGPRGEGADLEIDNSFRQKWESWPYMGRGAQAKNIVFVMFCLAV